MKKLFLLLLVIASCVGSVMAKDVLYLKNGSVIKGNIVELIPSEKIQFSTTDGSLFVYDASEIVKVVKETVDYNTKDVLYLTNGSIIKGYFKEINMGGKLSFETADGSTFVYNVTDAVKVAKDANTRTQSNNNTQSKNYTQNRNYTQSNTYSGGNNYQTSATQSSDANRHMAAKGFSAFINFVPLKGFLLDNVGYSWGLSATLGRQINHNFFVGGGIGFDMLLGDYGTDFMVPMYASVKGNVGRRIAQFTWGVRMGLAVTEYEYYDYYDNYYDSDVAASYYMNLSAGLRLGFTPKFALNILPEMDIYAGGYTNISLGVRLGFEF